MPSLHRREEPGHAVSGPRSHVLRRVLLGCGAVVALGIVGLVGFIVAQIFFAEPFAIDDSFPTLLVPPGATILRIKRDEPCYAYQTATIAPNDAHVDEWAKRLDLPCETAACTTWSSGARPSSFWRPTANGRVNGLDKVRALRDGATLTVDWGDYTCSGWN